MDISTKRFHELQRYLPFLEKKIASLKEIRSKYIAPDDKINDKIKRLQMIYDFVNDPLAPKRVAPATWDKFERIIKKAEEEKSEKHQQLSEKLSRISFADPHRPSSSCSSTSSFDRGKNIYDDTPASPSPPHSPAHSTSSHDSIPKIIPLERRPGFAPIIPMKSDPIKDFFRNKNSSPPPESLRIVPIPKTNMKDIGPLDWDSDGESESAPKSRPEIIVPKTLDVAAVAKRVGDSFPKKEPPKRELPKREEMRIKWDIEPMNHSSQNIPTVQVNALEGSRRLSTVIEKTNLLNNADFNRILSTRHIMGSPVSDDPLSSPATDFYHSSSAQSLLPPSTYSPPKRDIPPLLTSNSKVPATPTLLLNAPHTTSKLPISFDDISEYLEDSSLRRSDGTAKHQSSASRPPTRPTHLPNSSPIMLSPRSESNVMPPLSDPRVSSDPRSRPSSNDPRNYSIPSIANNDPRLASNHSTIPQVDPRSHPIVPPSDPRSHSVAGARYADSYERHKRNTESSMPSDFQRHSYVQETVPTMVPPPMHGPGTGSGTYGQRGPSNQMGYDYWMGAHPQQQQWNQQSHIQQTASPSYQMTNQTTGWQSQIQPHSMINGDSRMGHTYQNQMQTNMGRNDSHVQNVANHNATYSQNRNPSYQDTRSPYNMSYEQQQSQTRPPWNNRINDSERFPVRPPFGTRPSGPPTNQWNKEVQRPSRDPRTFSDRDPRTRPEPLQPVASSMPPPKEIPTVPKGPSIGKDAHPNKLKPVQPVEKEVPKKRPEINKTTNPVKEKLKEKHKEKNKDKHKHSDKSKSKDSKKLQVTDIYGTIDAKKAVKGSGLQKFKIPKKRPSNDAKEAMAGSEDNIEDSDVSIISDTNKQTEKSSKFGEKIKDKANRKDKNKEKDDILDKIKDIDEIDGIRELAAEKNLSKEEIAIIFKQMMKQYRKKNKKSAIYSSDEENENEEDSHEKAKKKASKKKKVTKKIIESSDESEIEKISEKKKEKKKKKKAAALRKIMSDESEPEEKKNEVHKDENITDKSKGQDIRDRSDDNYDDIAADGADDNNVLDNDIVVPVIDNEAESKVPDTSDKLGEEEVALVTEEEKAVEAPIKRKPKRRYRELDALQEDLKSSWICDGAMKATGSRSCSQRNKDAVQEKPTEETSSISSATAKNIGKMKKPLPPRAKPGPKSKKAALAAAATSGASSTSCLGTSDSEEDDTPLSCRSENLNADGKPKKDTSPKSGKKARAKPVKVQPPPLFDDSSNDSFNLDVSAVEPSTDISLHPETEKAVKEKNMTKTKSKVATDAAAESSSDESIDTAAKQRDINEELLDDVMAELATNPKYSVAKKKQTKKKRSNWKMGIVTKKKKKKATTSTAKGDDVHGSTSDLSVTNENDIAAGESVSSSKKVNNSLELNESSEKVHDESEDSGWKSMGTAHENEDLISRVDPEALIGYTQGNNNKYQCLLCTFYRKNIVHHYKTQHAKKEVLISRLSATESTLALEESSRLDLENNDPPPETDTGRYICRFCTFMTKGIDSVARETFYEHCTNHTGEYRFMCQQCGYESVTKGSIRAHFYKECRKLSNMNLNEAVVETPIPADNRIYGYMCSKCNFVQLKKSNVEKHVKLWHTRVNKDIEVKIVKVDMSVSVKREDVQMSAENPGINETVVKKVEPKEEKEPVEAIVTEEFEIKNDIEDSTVFTKTEQEKSPLQLDADASELSITLEMIDHKPEKKDNLSAFVCPDEIANKEEEEIQNERKKKMEEIAQNIGIKVGKEETQKRISIIDKLKDKIETAMPVDEIETTLPEKMETEESTAVDESQDPLRIPDQEVEKSVANNTNTDESKPEISASVEIKNDPEEVGVISTEKDDKANNKIKDPLAFVDESAGKTVASDDDATDSDREVLPTLQYDSESDQSDHEIPAPDVSSILQGTGEISSPSKGRMMTTIQRLAAQLKTKPPETPPLPEPEMVIADVGIKTEQSSPKKNEDDMAVLSQTDVKTEADAESKNNNESKANEEGASKKDTGSPKAFIRIRRISGDKLSKGGEQECESNNEQSMAVLKPIESQQSQSAEDDANFGFRIENIVSLAPNDRPNKLVPIRKVIDTSPQKSGLSLLKKPSQYIIKRSDGTSQVLTTTTGEPLKLVPISMAPTVRTITKPTDNYLSIGGQISIKIDPKTMQPLSTAPPNTTSTATTLVTSTGQPIKLVKINAPEQMSVIKLKSANVYERMLEDEKLLDMFKCMGRDCSFTTSSEPGFAKHIKMHEDDSISRTLGANPRDFYKCAYCYIDCKNYDDLVLHLKSMHTFCRYCCKYCFYRAFAHIYVEVHQKSYHPMKNPLILVMSEELVHMPPLPKRLDRKQIIKPYVCVHDCNKYFFIPEAFMLHLNMHHKNIISGYKCHVCFSMALSTDALIEHYKQHGYFKYHCMYCSHGAAKVQDMAAHLSSTHNNQPPQMLERCLPREISKNLSAIDQLRVRDVEHMFMQRKHDEINRPKIAIPPLVKSSPASILPAPPVMATKILSPKETLMTNIDASVSNIRIINTRSLQHNTTSLLNIGKNIKLTLSETPKLSSFDSQLLQKNQSSSDNLFDNKNQNDAKAADDTNDDNDDVVFLEEISTQPSDTKKEQQESKQGSKIVLKVKQEALCEDEDSNKANESEPNNSNISASADPLASVSKPIEPSNGRFLTLEDIKDTGFAGHELFRCGVENCQFSAETSDELRSHMQLCSPSNEESGSQSEPPLYCMHCGSQSKRFAKPNSFIDHLKIHGLKRFGCSLCDAKFAMQSQATCHLRLKHKFVTSRFVPADPTNPSPDGVFFIHPVTSDKVKGKKGQKAVIDKSLAEQEKMIFLPSEIDKLPLPAIFNKAVQCAICSYTNKVRTNVVRHLQAHLKDESVPTACPVNPVPCLDKKERMFDKMVNLASSSHENGRMGGGGGGGGGSSSGTSTASKDANSEEDEVLPKFVPESKRYVCGVAECNYLTVDEVMLRHHLKALHSDEVYFRCPHCPPPNGQDPGQNIALEKMGVHLKMHDCRLYKCSHCIYHHYHRHVVERHLADKHAEKRQFVRVVRELQSDQQTTDNQQQTLGSSVQEPEEDEQPDPDGNTWKCNLCDFKCVLKAAIQNHAAIEHNERCQFKCHGCNFKTNSKLTFDQHMTVKHANDSGINCTTVYRRIRTLKKPEPTETPSIPEEPFDTTPLWSRHMPRIRHIRGILLEEEEAHNETGKSHKRKSNKSIPEDPLKSPEPKKQRTVSIDDIEKLRAADGSFGPYGSPIGDQYTCTICNWYKSRYKQDFRDHVYRDLKYLRWVCSFCDYKSVNRAILMKHHNSKHSSIQFSVEPLSPDAQIEDWVAMVVKTQADMMKANKMAIALTAAEDEAEAEAEAEAEVEESGGEGEDDEYVIDSIKIEEEEIEDIEMDNVSSELLSEAIFCKHCNMKFIKWRGFKRHVQLRHLKRLGFLCPYCDRSTNSEVVMLQHVRSKHKGLPEKVLENPNPQTNDLTAEFWEREYGLFVPKRQKKRKRVDDQPVVGVTEDGQINVLPCTKCDFTALNVAGLKNHMRTHETKVKQKCNYCTFSSFNLTEMRQHWEVNHSHLEFKVEEAIVTSAAMDVAALRVGKKAKYDDEKKSIVYHCYYCSMSSQSLDMIRHHWQSSHKDDNRSLMFKYKEHSEVRVKCAYCAEDGTKSTLIHHIRGKHGFNKPLLMVEREEDGWMCDECREFLANKDEIEEHNNRVHPEYTINVKLVRRSFVCKQCGFDTISADAMLRHAKSHLNAYKCKYCNEMFKSYQSVKNHFKLVHSDKEPETRTLTTDEQNRIVDSLMRESVVISHAQLSPVKVPNALMRSPPTSPRLAKKSTTKQCVRKIWPTPDKIKAVARKSTNPLPRYPSGIVFEIEERPEPNYFSYYGRPASPVDLSKYNTTLNNAGLKIKVDCAKFAEFSNIDFDPKLKLFDCMKSNTMTS